MHFDVCRRIIFNITATLHMIINALIINCNLVMLLVFGGYSCTIFKASLTLKISFFQTKNDNAHFHEFKRGIRANHLCWCFTNHRQMISRAVATHSIYCFINHQSAYESEHFKCGFIRVIVLKAHLIHQSASR